MASLHQGIADLLPTRLEFYESWLNPPGCATAASAWRRWRRCSASCARKGEPYQLIAARAGEYTAEWSGGRPAGVQARRSSGAAPPRLRVHLVMRLARRWCAAPTAAAARSSAGARAGARSTSAGRFSARCAIASRQPLCEFYASALRRLMQLFSLDVEVGPEQCRATGAGQCLMVISCGQQEHPREADVRVWRSPGR